jgi:membrane glycosyltransferase
MDSRHTRRLTVAGLRADAPCPPIARASMVPQPWTGFLASVLSAFIRRLRGEPAPACADAPAPWEGAAARRRRALLLAIGASALAAALLLARTHLGVHDGALAYVLVGLYTLLFAWISAGFVTALIGFAVQLRGDRHALCAAAADRQPITPGARTAIVMPVCNEDVRVVFAGLRATCESLAATGASRLFDVYVLSDTSDPLLRAAELAAWGQLRDALGEGPRIYYRWRQRRTRRKAGNVADFCRRWGRNYRYMVVLDADSVMTGECLLSLVRLMEAHPRAGIIQTAPRPCGLMTVHARAQQFAGRVAGRLFTDGMRYWQLGESHYWGHNAIIRVEPFMKHCALAPLRGRGGRCEDILSHDFVEAALMRRAGYHVWLVSDLAGSYEQQPPHLLAELQRDRRWCQGNLQNLRLIAEPGLHAVHRAMLATGAMSYLSAPLWLAFVLLGTAAWLTGNALPAGQGLSFEMAWLWTCTVVMLILPRVLGVVAIVLRKELHLYGGAASLVKGVLLEGLLSGIQAPVRMIAHSMFVFVALTGVKLEWRSPPREAAAVSWGDAARRFALPGVAAAGLLAGVSSVDWGLGAWLLPMAMPLLLAMPLAVLTSLPSLGRKLLQRGVLVIPEESQMPVVLRHASAHARWVTPAPSWPDVITDPRLFELVRKSMGDRNTASGMRGHSRRRLLQNVLGAQDAEALSCADRMRLMSEPQSMAHLRDRLAANSIFGTFPEEAQVGQARVLS